MKSRRINPLLIIGVLGLIFVLYNLYRVQEHYVSKEPDLILHEFDPTTQVLTYEVTRPTDCTNCKLTFGGTLSLEGIERNNNFKFNEVEVTDFDKTEVTLQFDSPETPPPRILKYRITGDLRNYDTTGFVQKVLPPD